MPRRFWAGLDQTPEHGAEGALFDDVIAVRAALAHHPKGSVVFPPRSNEIPYCNMPPRKVDNVIVASGKSASTSVRGLIRAQTDHLVLGQGAGVAAAVAAGSGATARDVDLREVLRELLAQNIYLGKPDRLADMGLA